MTSSWPAFVFLGAMGGCIFGASGIFGQRRKHPCQTPMALLLLLTAVGMIPPFLILQSPQDFWEALDLLAPVVFSQLFVGALLAHYFTLLAPIPILDSSKSGILHAARVFRAFGSTWSLYSLPAVALLACSVYFYVLSDSASPERRLNTVAVDGVSKYVRKRVSPVKLWGCVLLPLCMTTMPPTYKSFATPR